jgi:hypothetical protein
MVTHWYGTPYKVKSRTNRTVCYVAKPELVKSHGTVAYHLELWYGCVPYNVGLRLLVTQCKVLNQFVLFRWDTY